MKNIIKELKLKYNHELSQIGLTPITSFKGTQEEHDVLHKEKADEYLTAINILSAKFQIREWLPPNVENFNNYKDAKKYFDNYLIQNKGINDCDIQLLVVIEDFMQLIN